MSDSQVPPFERLAPGGSRPEAVYQALKEALFAQRIGPGQRLREIELAEQLGVSRTPVREALQRLAAEGLAVHEPARGAIIAELNKNEILDLYAMREVLEGTAAFTAAQRATAEDIAELWRIIEKEKRHLPERVNLAAINKEFHHALTVAAHNLYLSRMADSLRDTVALLKGTSLVLENRAESAHNEHVAIVSAIEERDPERAEQVARQHIREARRLRMQMYYNHR